MRLTAKRVLAVVLCMCMLIGTSAITALAGTYFDYDSETHTVFSSTKSTLAPGIEQSINYAYASDGKQMVYYIATSDISRDDVELHSAYKDAQCTSYGMDKLTNQMAAADAKYQQENPYFKAVVGTNGDFYNMSTGQPSGAFAMDGIVTSNKANNRPWFATFADGTAWCGSNNTEWDAAVAAHGAVQEAVGGSQMLVVNGEDVTASSTGSYNTDRHSRTMVGVTADGKVVMAVLDGRQEPFSCGGSMHELAQIMLEQGCVTAINLDGGGSTTYASRPEGESDVKVINRPSDGSERSISSGLLVASTAAPSNVFERATLTAENKFVTPGSTVAVSAKGVSPAGTSAEIPEDVTYSATLGTVDANGVFTSDGTEGEAVVSMLYNGEVVGRTTINVVVPTAISFDNETITVPFGKTVELAITATCNDGLNKITMKPGDISFTLGEASVGTIDGFNFTAADDSTVTTSDITAVSVFDNSITASSTITLGKGSVVLYDFEGDNNADQLANFKRTAKSNYNYMLAPGLCALSTKENGKVHSGDYSMRVESDFTTWFEGGYMSAMINTVNKIDLSGAIRVGMWVYIPIEAFSLNGRLYILEVTGRDEDGNISSTASSYTTISLIDDGGDWNVGFNTQYDESGWHYIYADLPTGKDWCMSGAFWDMYINDRDNANYNYYHTQPQYKSGNLDLNLFIDDFTIDYSSAVDDREAPVFSSVTWADTSMSDAAVFTRGVVAQSSKNVISFGATVKDNTNKSNYTGLDESTAKAYVDGVETECAISNGIMSVSDITLADGIHSIKFAICDKQGNLATVIRKINIQAGSGKSTIKLVPHDESLDKILMGSLYYVDVVATDIEKVQSVSTTLDLNDISVWQLDHMDIAKGFDASYVIDDVYENIATLTITRTGDSDVTGEAALVSIPIRTYELPVVNLNGTASGVWMYDRYKKVNEILPIDIKVKVARGEVTFTDGSTDIFSGSDVQVDTECDSWFYNDTSARDDEYAAWNGGHDHRANTAQYYLSGSTNHVDAIALPDKEATCTEDGYTGRTYCEVCNSVVDWGTTIPATGHSYELVDGKLTCVNCGDLFNGEFEGKLYVDGVAMNGWNNDSYYIDGVKLTGIQAVDGYYYNFGDDGVCAGQTKYSGIFYDEEKSAYRYSQLGEISTGWKMIDGDWYYFRGSTQCAASGAHNYFDDITYQFNEKGKLLSGVWVTDDNNNTSYYYGPGIYKGSWRDIDGKRYYFDNNGYVYKGWKYVVESNSKIAQWFDFDLTTGESHGKLENYTGFYTNEDGLYYIENGDSNYGLFYIDGYYYYFTSINYTAQKGVVYVRHTNNTGMAVGEYKFDDNCRMIIPKNGIVEEDGGYYYYVNNTLVVGKGLVKIDGDYYYIRSNGQFATGTYFVYNISDECAAEGFVKGNQEFGADGKMVVSQQPETDPTTPTQPSVKNGIVSENGGLFYYENDVLAVGKGLIKVDGDYYYVRSNGQLATGTYFVYNISDECAAEGYTRGNQEFGTDGKMVVTQQPETDPTTPTQPTVKNGIVAENGGLFYYENDVLAVGKGLIKVDGDYYYVRSNGQLATGTYFVYNISDECAAEGYTRGNQEFGTDGKMVVTQQPETDPTTPTQPTVKNGIVAENDGLFYYENGKLASGKGLIKVDGDYYYVRSNGQLATGTYFVYNISDECAAEGYTRGNQEFGTDGKMVIS